jgi:hypothetical protein
MFSRDHEAGSFFSFRELRGLGVDFQAESKRHSWRRTNLSLLSFYLSHSRSKYLEMLENHATNGADATSTWDYIRKVGKLPVFVGDVLK